jgi:signal transduction histidine kinase
MAGIMMIGKFLDRAAIEKISTTIKLPFNIHSLNDPKIPKDFAAARSALTKTKPSLVRTLNSDTVAGYTLIRDISDNPAIIARITLNREIYREGKSTIFYFILWMIGVSLITAIISSIFLQKLIISRLAGINDKVVQIAGKSNFSERISCQGNDELTSLSKAINHMLSALEKSNAEVKHAYRKLKNTQAQLVQSSKLASIGELAAGVAHELNQPLSVIRLNCQLLSKSYPDTLLSARESVNALEFIERNTSRMMKIISHLRTFSRQSHGEFAPVAVNQIIENTFLMVGEQLGTNDIEVKKDLAENLPPILGNANLLEQVFLNLISNAKSSIEERRYESIGVNSVRTDEIKIVTKVSDTNQDAIEIVVKDSGKGIPEENIEKIFDPFFTTKEVGKGTGLGLSISYGVIKNHKGEIEVIDTGPGGTAFKITLPICKIFPNNKL